MVLPGDPPAGTTPTAFNTWAQAVTDTAQDHDTRIGTLETASGTHRAADRLHPGSGATLADVGATMKWQIIRQPDASNSDVLAAWAEVPRNWSTFDVVVRWVNAGTTAGDVYFQPVYEFDVAGGTLDGGPTVAPAVIATAGGKNAVVDTTLVAGLTRSAGTLGVRLQRQGGHASDTLAEGVDVLSIELRPL